MTRMKAWNPSAPSRRPSGVFSKGTPPTSIVPLFELHVHRIIVFFFGLGFFCSVNVFFSFLCGVPLYECITVYAFYC